MQLREAKQKVYAEYAHYIDAEDIYIQHASENFDYVAKLYAFKRASAFSEIVKSLKRSIPLAQLASIISTAADRAMMREKIRTKCYDVYIECEGERRHSKKFNLSMLLLRNSQQYKTGFSKSYIEKYWQ